MFAKSCTKCIYRDPGGGVAGQRTAGAEGFIVRMRKDDQEGAW